MRSLLLIALVACGVGAVPIPDDDSEVDLVPRRRVYTGSRAGPAYAGAVAGGYQPALDARDILRQLFGSGIPRLMPREDPNCDTGRFQLSDAVYDKVEQCQRSGSAQQDLRQCILEGLPDDAGELKEFLDRDEFSITGISSSFSIVIADGEMTQKRVVSFRLCPPSDEQNTVEETPQPQLPAVVPFYRPSLPSMDSHLGIRPTFQMPDIFSPAQRNPFFNFDAFKPIFNLKPSDMFPSVNFPNFPTFPSFDFSPTEYDPETCVTQTFQLPKEQYTMAQSCQFGEDFKECLTEKLSAHEEAKELLQFVGADDMVVTGRRFYESMSSVNGVVTYKSKIQLTHCKEVEADEDAPEGDEGQQSPPAEEEAPVQGEEKATPPAPETPQETTEQKEAYQGEDFEP